MSNPALAALSLVNPSTGHAVVDPFARGRRAISQAQWKLRFIALAAIASFIGMLLSARPLRADEDDPNKSKDTTFETPKTEMMQMQPAPGFKVELFAAEPMVRNPSAFTIDEKGRFYVCEANRRRNAVLDIRKNLSMQEEDLACRTVEDRIAMIKRHFPGKKMDVFTAVADRVRIIEDRDGDGKADHDAIFADNFNAIPDGVMAGIISRNGTFWVTEIPNLWMLKDTTGSGKADFRQSLAYGFGIRFNYGGHDMHGLRFGPDGKLYFSIADRAAHVEKDGKTIIDNPDTGAVYRCDPDGSNLELFHTGLRNPQELAFDEFGNLFTCDNNSDAGDISRWVYCVEGGDSGWRVTYQWHTYPVSRGPWMTEKPWMVNPPVPCAYRLPPIATPAISGPSGLTYNGGPGLPEAFANHFLLVDFRGGAAGGSGVYALKNKPAGASFELTDFRPLVTNVLPSDVEIGYAGGAYVLDWVEGWDPKGQGRIYHVFEPESAKNPLVAETKKLMGDGMQKRQPAELGKLLAHADMRVRQAAQFELADREQASIPTFIAATQQKESQLARLHGIWGLGQIARKSPDAVDPILPLLADGDDEIRTQAAKTLEELRAPAAHDGFVKLLSDKSPRARFYAALGIGKLGQKADVPKIFDLLRENADADAYLRHAGVIALTWLNDPAALIAVGATPASPALATPASPSASATPALAEPSAAVRMGALLALRRLHAPQIGQFLTDPDPNVILETARAINDEPIEAARPALAAALNRPGMGEHVLIRAVNANSRLGTPEAAKALADYASHSTGLDSLRAESLRVLSEWDQPLGRDRVTGQILPPGKRQPGLGKTTLAAILPAILENGSEAVRVAALTAGTTAGIESRSLYDIVSDKKQSPGFRAAAIGAMAAAKDGKLYEAVKLGLADSNEQVRISAIHFQPKQADGVKPLKKFLDSGSPREQQAVLQALADNSVKTADEMLISAFDRLEKGTLPPEAQLDLLTTAEGRKKGSAKDRSKKYEDTRAKAAGADVLATHTECLAGGNASRGEWIFRERQDVSCLRCHSIKGQGGNAGPDLAGVVTRAGTDYKNPRQYILESILLPNKKIAPGFETVTLRTDDGDVLSGTLKVEDDKTVSIDIPNQGIQKVEKSHIKKRQGGLSAMPEDISKPLSKQDLRDLVEFLAGQ
jgi:quinoprotein glucose dehydrogenase